MDSELKERISRMSDDELFQMVNVDFADYREDAIDFAEAELIRRGVSEEEDSAEEDDGEKSNETEAGFVPDPCPKCTGDMTEGFIPLLSQIDDDGRVSNAFWIQGRLKHGFLPKDEAEDMATFGIKTYRCAECGYLEFYARRGEVPA